MAEGVESLDDQTAAWEALGKIRLAIGETFPSIIVPRGAADAIAAEEAELAAICQTTALDPSPP